MPRGGRRPGTGGHNRKSVEEKRFLGTLRPGREAAAQGRRAAKSGLASIPVAPPPDDLDQGERASWEQLGAAVDAVGTYTVADCAAFQLMARSHALLQRIQAERDQRGQLRATVASIAGLTRVVTGMMARFGLDPASRGPIRVAVPEPEPLDDDPDDIQPLAPVRMLRTERPESR